MSRYSIVLFTSSLASLALARTDLTGCTSTDVSSPAGASVAWYVPGTGELCDFLDCGGGMAPPKTTVPGCPQYSGTATYSPSYLPGYGSMTASATGVAPSAEGSMSTSLGVVSASSGDAEASETSNAAWSETSETNTSLQNSAVEVTSYQTASASMASGSASSGMSTITSSPTAGVVPVGGNGTSTGTGSGSGSGSNGNGTVSSASPSPITSNSGAMATARVWLGGSALLGLGAIVAAL